LRWSDYRIEENNPAELSGGNEKACRVGAMRYPYSKILFCDEPTSGLDPFAAAIFLI